MYSIEGIAKLHICVKVSQGRDFLVFGATIKDFPGITAIPDAHADADGYMQIDMWSVDLKQVVALFVELFAVDVAVVDVAKKKK